MDDRELNRIAASGALADIETAFASLQPEALTGHVDQVLRLVDALTRRDLGDPARQTDLRERYLLATLEHPADLDLTSDVALLDRLGDPAQRPLATEPLKLWNARRRRLGQTWLRALERHAAVLAENGDAVPQLNIRPPAATGLPAGAAPEAIEDPALRASYEADLERNRAVAERRLRGDDDRRLARATIAKAEQRAIAAYRAKPTALAELAQDLAVISDAATRQRILEAVSSES